MELREEARIKLDELRSQYNKAAHKVLLQEARDNNPYGVGDILEDHFKIGKVLSVCIGINVLKRTYQVSYTCDRLTKKLVPYASGEVVTILLCNVKNKI